jgi:riboflavin synthase
VFTGLVEAQSRLQSVMPIDGGKRLSFSHTFDSLSLGESIAVSGACLTVVAFDKSSFDVEASFETLRLTTLGDLKTGATVNLERALKVGDRLGGHLVTGHIDGTATVSGALLEGEMKLLSLDITENLLRYVARKGSLTVDGVSLTVNEVSAHSVDLVVIPHTQKVTTLGALGVGARVNIEVDLLARYVERLALPFQSPRSEND